MTPTVPAIVPAKIEGPPQFKFKAVRQPVFWAMVAHSIGILAGFYLWRPDSWWMIAASAFMAAAAFFVKRRTWFAWFLVLGAVFLVGAWNIQLRENAKHLDASLTSFADGQPLGIIAHVIRNGRILPGTFGETRQSVDVETESVTTQFGASVPVRSGIRLSIYSPHVGEKTSQDESIFDHDANPMRTRIFSYGQRIRFSTKLRLPRNFRTPGAFDYASYLADNGIAALGSAKSAEIELLSGFQGNRFEAWRSKIRESIIARVHQLWSPHDAVLIDAMVIGEEAFIDRDTRTDFQRSGTYHVLIVSGMNVSILAFVIFWALRRLRLAELPATLLTIGACAAYALLTEVGAPVWRATLMCAAYLCTRLLYRDRAMVNAIGGAALAVLIFDPQQLFTASFQMTFLCVLIVAAIGLPMLDRTSQFYKRALAHWDSRDFGRTLAPEVAQFRLDLQMIAERLARFAGEKWAGKVVRSVTSISIGLFELLFVSAVMQMGMALPMAYYFHRATTIGLPANISVVPLMQLMMPSTIAVLVLSAVSLTLAKAIAFIPTLALHGIVGTVHGLGRFHLADLRVPTPSLAMIISAIAALGLAMILARRRALVSIAGLLALLVVSLVLAFIPAQAKYRAGVLEVTSIDIGEGDSHLLVTPEGKTLLIDAGGPIGPGSSQFDFGEDVISPYLWARGIARLDAVAITHGHSDHIGGMAAVLKNFRPRELWLGLRPPSSALDRLIDEAEALHIHVIRHWEGDNFDFGGARVQVLFPPQDWPVGPKPENNDSLVLEVGYLDSSVLLEGDAQKQVERRIAALHHPKVNLLKIGHHGSANATSPELLEAAKPEFAMISVGYRNSFGLPKFEILERLSQAGVKVYRTDIEGAVTFYLDGRSVTPSLEGPESLH